MSHGLGLVRFSFAFAKKAAKETMFLHKSGYFIGQAKLYGMKIKNPFILGFQIIFEKLYLSGFSAAIQTGNCYDFHRGLLMFFSIGLVTLV